MSWFFILRERLEVSYRCGCHGFHQACERTTLFCFVRVSQCKEACVGRWDACCVKAASNVDITSDAYWIVRLAMFHSHCKVPASCPSHRELTTVKQVVGILILLSIGIHTVVACNRIPYTEAK